MLFWSKKNKLYKKIFEDHNLDELFHITIAKATKNTVLEHLQQELWCKQYKSKMWQELHTRIQDRSYYIQSLHVQERILQALKIKDPYAAKQAMWQHLEYIKH